jgi:hypothetical protein
MTNETTVEAVKQAIRTEPAFIAACAFGVPSDALDQCADLMARAALDAMGLPSREQIIQALADARGLRPGPTAHERVALGADADAIIALLPTTPAPRAVESEPVCPNCGPLLPGTPVFGCENPSRETPTPAPVVTVEQVEQALVREWHQDQCACREFDGVDMETCYSRIHPMFPGSMREPSTWTVEAVLNHYRINVQAGGE